MVGEVLFPVDFVSRSVDSNPYHSEFMVMTHSFNLLDGMIELIFDVKKKKKAFSKKFNKELNNIDLHTILRFSIISVLLKPFHA